jgi:hypothetical protein
VVSGSASLSTTATAASGVGGYTITAGPGSLSAVNYTFAFANGTLTVLSAGGPVGTPVSPPGSPAPVASTSGSNSVPPSPDGRPALLVPVDHAPITPMFSTSSGTMNDTGASNPNSSTNSVARLGGITLSGQSVNQVLEVSSPMSDAPSQVIVDRTLHALGVNFQSGRLAEQERAESFLTEEPAFHSPVARLAPLSAPAAPTHSSPVQADDLLDVLSETTVLAGTGLLAGSGYVLLNSRLGLWLLGVLSARPLWRQFDPLEVLYAWEGDFRNRPANDEDEETLMSLVD